MNPSIPLKASLALAAGLLSMATWADITPIGTWHSIDDKTQQPRSAIVITEEQGVLTGRITQLLREGADQNARCTACTDDRKDQPMIGLEIIRGARQAEGRTVWEGGRILDPENGRSYSLRLTPIDGGQRMEVRGAIGPIGRTQTWVRVQ